MRAGTHRGQNDLRDLKREWAAATGAGRWWRQKVAEGDAADRRGTLEELHGARNVRRAARRAGVEPDEQAYVARYRVGAGG